MPKRASASHVGTLKAVPVMVPVRPAHTRAPAPNFPSNSAVLSVPLILTRLDTVTFNYETAFTFTDGSVPVRGAATAAAALRLPLRAPPSALVWLGCPVRSASACTHAS